MNYNAIYIKIMVAGRKVRLQLPSYRLKENDRFIVYHLSLKIDIRHSYLFVESLTVDNV